MSQTAVESNSHRSCNKLFMRWLQLRFDYDSIRRTNNIQRDSTSTQLLDSALASDII